MEKVKAGKQKKPTAFARAFALSFDVIVGVQGIFKIKVLRTYQAKELLTT